MEYWLDKEDEFYALVGHNSPLFRQVSGQRVRLDAFPELDAFIVAPPCGWTVYEGVTGTVLRSKRKNWSCRNREKALALSSEYLEQCFHGDRAGLRTRIEANIARFGLSPRYRTEESPE
ncbi:MAG: hypothetical protein Q7O66_16870 [Dehalococcoidia bacterium]|nr:hypothetical protein [Dehalococcoidia bacterium]